MLVWVIRRLTSECLRNSNTFFKENYEYLFIVLYFFQEVIRSCAAKVSSYYQEDNLKLSSIVIYEKIGLHHYGGDSSYKHYLRCAFLVQLPFARILTPGPRIKSQQQGCNFSAGPAHNRHPLFTSSLSLHMLATLSIKESQCSSLHPSLLF